MTGLKSIKYFLCSSVKRGLLDTLNIDQQQFGFNPQPRFLLAVIRIIAGYFLVVLLSYKSNIILEIQIFEFILIPKYRSAPVLVQALPQIFSSIFDGSAKLLGVILF